MQIYHKNGSSLFLKNWCPKKVVLKQFLASIFDAWSDSYVHFYSTYCVVWYRLIVSDQKNTNLIIDVNGRKWTSDCESDTYQNRILRYKTNSMMGFGRDFLINFEDIDFFWKVYRIIKLTITLMNFFTSNI